MPFSIEGSGLKTSGCAVYALQPNHRACSGEGGFMNDVIGFRANMEAVRAYWGVHHQPCDHRIFSVERGADGKRSFIVSTYAAFWARYQGMLPQHRHYYEIIRQGWPCHLYFGMTSASAPSYTRPLCEPSLVHAHPATTAAQPSTKACTACIRTFFRSVHRLSSCSIHSYGAASGGSTCCQLCRS